MSTIRDYAKKQLPEKIFNELVIEVEKQGVKNMDDPAFFGDIGWFKECMYWGKTSQGFDYWYDIDAKYVNKRDVL